MENMLTNSAFFGAMITIVAYEIGLFIKNKCRLAIFNPLLISMILIIVCLCVFHIDYNIYYQGAQYISYLLTPATVCLALPLYEQFELLKKHKTAILAGILAGVLTSALCILALAMLFQLNHKEYVTLLPKSITTAIGMKVSEELGGMVTVTVVTIVITGVIGNMMAEQICKWFHITEPIATGVAIGTASHAMGTTKAMELGEVQGAMSSLSIGVAGLLTVIVSYLFSSFW